MEEKIKALKESIKESERLTRKCLDLSLKTRLEPIKEEMAKQRKYYTISLAVAVTVSCLVLIQQFLVSFRKHLLGNP